MCIISVCGILNSYRTACLFGFLSLSEKKVLLNLPVQRNLSMMAQRSLFYTHESMHDAMFAVSFRIAGTKIRKCFASHWAQLCQFIELCDKLHDGKRQREKERTKMIDKFGACSFVHKRAWMPCNISRGCH